jgi:hypothetical protein
MAQELVKFTHIQGCKRQHGSLKCGNSNYKTYLRKNAAFSLYNALTTRFSLKLQGYNCTTVKYPEEAYFRLLFTSTLPCADVEVSTHDLNTASSSGSHMLQSLAKGPNGNEHGTVFTTTALDPYISPLSRQNKARSIITKTNKQAILCFHFKLQQLSCDMTRHDVTPNNSSNKTLHYITYILPSITLLAFLSFTL